MIYISNDEYFLIVINFFNKKRSDLLTKSNVCFNKLNCICF